MKAFRFLRALPLVTLLAGAPLHAEQGTIVGPTVGPKTMTEVMTTLNAALLAIQSCNSGTSAPANGPGGLPKAFQCWADTSASPVITYKTYDGVAWVAFGKLNTSTHVWTPVYQGTDLGTASVATTGVSGHTVPFLDTANTWSGTQSINSGNLALKGSTSGAGTLNAPAVASSYVWTLPALTDTLVGKATVDTLTNKTFDTAATGNSFSINGLAATANTGTGSVVRATSPTLVTPTIGAATATSINGNIWTAGTGTLTLGAGKTATISNTLTFAGADGSTVTVGAGGTVAYLANTLNAFASTTSAQLAAVISDETGSGALVFGTSPTLVTPTLGAAAAISINKVAITAPAAGATLTIPDGVTLTGPAASGTAMTLGNAETVTGAKSFNDATVILKGATSGTTTVKAAAVAGTTTLTLPAATDTLVSKTSTDTLTNKTFDTAGAGNSLAINGLAATANTGTGAVVRAVSPAITTPTGIVKGDVGLGNVDNTSDASKNAATATLTNKTLTAPVINSPTGIVKGDVGLGNVDNTSDLNKPVSTAQAAADALKANAANPVLTGVLDAQGAVKFSSQATPAQITADQNNYNPSSAVCSTTTTLILTSDAARSITGLAGGVAGCEMRVINAGSFTISLLEQSASSTAANRFNFSGNLALASGQAANIVYDGVNSRWRQIGGPSSSGGGSGTMTQVICGNQTITTSGTCQTDSGLGIQNCSIGASVASNLLTINLLDASGATPSSISPCRINFRSATASSGVVTSNYTTGATSISTFATGATLGSSNATAFRFWVVAFDNSGTTVLGLINCSTSTQIFPLDESAVASSTAMSGSATAAGTFYTPNGTALTSKTFRILGYIEYGATGLTTAGTYASAPSSIQLFGPGIKKPGDLVQTNYANFASQNSTTSSSYVDSGLTAPITLRSAANLVRSEYSTILVIGNPGETITSIMAQDGTAVGSASQYSTTATGFNYAGVSGLAYNKPNKTTAAIYVVRFRNSTGTNTVYFGNSIGATMAVHEIMG
jgi:hypothetical protein